MARSRLHRRYVKNSDREPKRNPPISTDMFEFIIPGFGAFAVTRAATRIAATQIAQRAPSWGKHAGAGVSIGAFLAAWLLAHKVKWLEKYHTPIVVGSAIAALQSLIQLYIPRLGWLVSDASPEIDQGAQSQLAAATAAADPISQLNLQPTSDDPNEYQYNDSFDAGRYSRQPGSSPGPRPSSASGPSSGPASGDLSDLAIEDAIGQSANLGVFSN